MYLNKLKAGGVIAPPQANARDQAELYNRMCLAIERIETFYEPSLRFDGHTQGKKDKLDRMELKTAADIAAWESGWLDLIAVIKKHLKTRANRHDTAKGG